MIRKILSAMILLPLILIGVMFAVANRQTVTVSFDPFDAAQPAYAASLPLFALIFLLLVLGVLIGGIAAWLGQGKWRRVARHLDADVRKLRDEVHGLRSTPAGRQSDQAAPLVIPPPPL